MKELTEWYQKKISSYDKEEWETMVEQLLMRGIYKRHVSDFTTKIRPYLIDVDLVRGSSFPKAKPSMGVWCVLWYGIIRVIFLPCMYTWWKQQTSSSAVKLLFTLWLMQLINIMLYVFTPNDVEIDITSVLVPGSLMLGLSIVHAQIVNTTVLEINRARPRAGSKQYRESVKVVDSESDQECESKMSKYRRRQIITRTKTDDIDGDGLRNRKKGSVERTVVKPQPIDLVRLKQNKKVKDSDDEDYMEWKRPSTSTNTTPTVKFTSPPDEKEKTPIIFNLDRESSVNLKKGESFVKSNGDFDDGFESLNGNVSNFSDNENRSKIDHILKLKRAKSEPITPTIKTKKPTALNCKCSSNDGKSTSESVGNISEGSNLSEKIFLKIDGKLRTKTDGADSFVKKRTVGVRFRNSWVKEMMEPATSDDGHSEAPSKPEPKIHKKYTSNSSSSEGECETGSGPSAGQPSHHTVSDWVGQTTNSDDCSYSSESEVSHLDIGYRDESALDPFTILNPASDTVKCTIWEHGEMMKAHLTAVDISWYVVARAEHAIASGSSYLWAGIVMAASVSLITPTATLLQVALEQDTRDAEIIQSSSALFYLPSLVWSYSEGSIYSVLKTAFGQNYWAISMNVISCFLRFSLSGLCFFLLAVAERAFKQRFLYAKLFCHLTSARRARKSELPHFRLNTVRNIKTWLSARSYLRRRGPQRSVDVIVSAAFVIALVLLAFVSAQLLRESVSLECGGLLEAMIWCCCLGVWLLRLMTLGSNINRKYRGCLSALITEQINLHLAIEQRPQRKDQLTLANNVLKLAADLLKELDTPFKISGMCANHYLYTIFKVVILSAMSGVLSEMLGFKLKLYKIKIK